MHTIDANSVPKPAAEFRSKNTLQNIFFRFWILQPEVKLIEFELNDLNFRKKAHCIFFKNEELIVSIISSLFVHGKSYLRFRLSSRSVLLIIVVTRVIFHLLSLYIPELNPRTRLTVRPYFTVFLSSVSGDG